MRLRVLIGLFVALILAASVGQAQTDPDWIKQKLEQFGRAPEPVKLAPKPGKQTLNIAGDTKRVYDSIGTAFGIQITYDENMPTRPVQFHLQDVDFHAAMAVAGQMTRTFYVPLTTTDVLVANDTPAKRRELETYILKTYYFHNISSPQELNDMVNLLRTVFEVRFLVPQPANYSVEVRAPQQTVDAIDRFLATLSTRPPQVMLDVHVLEVNRTALRTIGMSVPLQFQIFNIGAAALAAINSPNVQNLINQLIANGGLSAANSGSLAALVGQLQNQQNSILSNPIATFGGGLTLMGVGIPPVTANFQRNDSRVVTLEHAQLQASEGNAASLHIGDRLPVITQSFSSGVQLANIPGATLGNIGGVIPGFQYEDLGITVKATPNVHGSESVTLNLELSIRSEGAIQSSGAPIINNREYKGVISVKNGEPAVIAGMISRSESRSLSGLPGLSNIPFLREIGATVNNNENDDEILVILTPQITSARETSSQEILMPRPGQ
jgi:type II secretory pathway component HofQ